MKYNKIILLAIMLLASICQAQYLEVSKAKVVYEKAEVTTVSVVDKDGKVLKTYKIEAEPEPAVEKELTVVKANTTKVPTFSFTNQQREDVSSLWTKLDDKAWATSVSGKYWIEIDSPAYGILDPETNMVQIFDEDEKLVLDVVGPDPVPPSPDDEDDTDDGDFDNISQRVSVASKGLDKNKELADFFTKMANDMKTFKIIRAKDAKTIINKEMSKYPNYSSVLELLKKDAENRLMGWTETINYYQAIAKGFQ